MTTKPLVSVIVACFNSQSFIHETLNCLLSVDYPNWECIVVDDGSTDNSHEIISKFCKKNDRYRVIRQPNSGPSVARNLAIQNSNGKYILPLDADDLISATYISQAVEVLENNSNIKVVYCNAEKFGYKEGFWHLPEYSFQELLKENMIFCTALYRKEDFLKTRGYDPLLRLGREDWNFWLEMLKTGGEVYKLPEVHFYYRTHKKSRDKEANKNLSEIRKRIYENHKELYAHFFDNPIQIAHEHAFYKKKYNVLRKLTFKKPID